MQTHKCLYKTLKQHNLMKQISQPLKMKHLSCEITFLLKLYQAIIERIANNPLQQNLQQEMHNLNIGISCLQISQNTLFTTSSPNTAFSLKQLTIISQDTKIDEDINQGRYINAENRTQSDKMERDVMIWFISKGIKEGYPQEVLVSLDSDKRKHINEYLKKNNIYSKSGYSMRRRIENSLRISV